ncbi:hypothetical protein [Lysinibacillus fusiformis]|uniref:hypothetical protein n=1 Tax=Lysinibacillus fusiformis TaxID=28031 RepID=UPI00301ACBA8
MNKCPNCLASNPLKKVYKDGLVLKKCEYCNTIVEDTTQKEVTVRVQNEIQNDGNNSDSSRKALAIATALMIIYFIIETFSKLF